MLHILYKTQYGDEIYIKIRTQTVRIRLTCLYVKKVKKKTQTKNET